MSRFLGFMALAFALICSPAWANRGDDELNKFVRVFHEGKARYGVLSLGMVRLLSKSFFEEGTGYTGEIVPLKETKLLAPVEPTKVIAIALNYASHGGSPKKNIGMFSKLPSSIIGPDETIIPPPGSPGVHYEGEMVVVMGAQAKNVKESEAADYIFGITIGNDISDRSIGTGGFAVIRGKGSDTFGPLGPWVVRGLNYDDLELITRVNGKVVQKTRTSKMINSTHRIISYISQYITLEPGDVVYTGTSGTTRLMKAGDVVEVQLEGVGTLKNPVGAPEK